MPLRPWSAPHRDLFQMRVPVKVDDCGEGETGTGLKIISDRQPARLRARPAAGDHLPAVTALSSSSDSRMSCGKSAWLVSLIQRSNAILKTAIPASAARLAAGSVTPRWRNVPASAGAGERGGG